MAFITVLLTDFVHGGCCGQIALLQELLPGLLVLHLDLRHHVARHKAQATATLSPVKPVWIFVSMNLVKHAIVKNQIFTDWHYARCHHPVRVDFRDGKQDSGWICSLQGRTLMICPSEKGSSSSAASGLGDMVAGS